MPLIDFSKERPCLGLKATVCIVGTGPAGAFLAVDLAASGVDVLVLETGFTKPDVDVSQSINTTSILGGASPRYGFSRQLGGASNLWAGRSSSLALAAL